MSDGVAAPAYLLGIIGWPVAHSKSPAMHQAAASDLNFDLAYVRLPVHPGDLPAAMHGLPALGFHGVNVTVPHKQKVIQYLDEIDLAAKTIGAVNTIVIKTFQDSGKKMVGYNTDWSGFLADLKKLKVEVNGRQCYILGAGGAARAVAYALAISGGRVTLFARRVDQVQALIDHLHAHEPGLNLRAQAWQTIETFVGEGSANPLIVNCTPLGMEFKQALSPWPEQASFPAGAIVYDLVYIPAETRFLSSARKAGCRTANGLGMLLQQGAQAFRLWTGVDPDLQIMATAIK